MTFQALGTMELLKQQRLPAWQPILTPPYVALCFFLVSFFFIPIGSIISVLNKDAKEISFRYDNIQHCTNEHNTGAFTYSGNNETLGTGCTTLIAFDITETLNAPVYLYYGLTNFYQNHRRYSNSRSDPQLAGRPTRHIHDASPLVVPGEITGTMHTPINYMSSANLQYRDFVYVPAGLIAWSMFNDTFVLYKEEDVGATMTEKAKNTTRLICNATDFSKAFNTPLGGSVSPNLCRKKGIAWETDVKSKFRAPDLAAHHRFWTAARELYTGEKPEPPVTNDTFFNNGWYANELGHDIPVTTDEDLMVWMRAASLPSFRKLHRIIDESLTPGRYVMVIGEHFDVSSFGGTKTFTLATLSSLGGKNTYLAAMYFAVGGLAAVGAAVLLLVHRFYGNRAANAINELLQK